MDGMQMEHITQNYQNMKINLFLSKKLEVRKSDIHGYGVFTNELIHKGELLEECHYIEASSQKEMKRYMFNFPKGTKPKKFVIPLGFGSIYNTSNSKDENNIDWITDLDNDILVFSATKEIKANEELLSWYNYTNGNIYK
jgi:SET domain-containing protein